MRTSAVFTAIAATVTLVKGQVTFEPDGTFTCVKALAAYCAGDSLSTNIIIRCGGDAKGQPGNCNDNLAGVPPVGVKSDATCYESSPLAGDAACSFDGIVYGPNGTFPVPSNASSTSTALATIPTADPPSYAPPAYTTAPPYPIPRDLSAGAGSVPTGTVGTAAGTGTGGGLVPTYTAVPVSNDAAGLDSTKFHVMVGLVAVIGAIW